MMRIRSVYAAMVLLLGCQTPEVSSVREIGNGGYFVTLASAPAESGARERLMRLASEKAERFCVRQGKTARLRDLMVGKKDEDTIIAFDCR
jgi:hypothetical protein